MPILQRFVSKYPPRYYLGPERLNGAFPKNASDFKCFIRPYPPPYRGALNEPIISNYDSWRCWHELYYFLKWNDFGKYFAFSEAKHGVCCCFRGECEFSLQVDDRFAIEIHAFELQTPWDAPDKSPQIRRYIGVFFFASDDNLTTRENDHREETYYEELSKLHMKYKKLDEIYSGKNDWPDNNDLYPERWLREAIVRRPQHMIRPPYRFVRFFPLSLNYGLEGFDGIPYAFPGKEGRCIHAAIYLATLLTSQWSIPIPPIESTFHLAMVTQDNIKELNECFDGLQKIVNEYDINFANELNLFDVYQLCFKVFKGSQYYAVQNKKREGFEKALEKIKSDFLYQFKLINKSYDNDITYSLKDIEDLFNKIENVFQDIYRSCVEIGIEYPDNYSRTLPSENYQYFMNVLGMSVRAAMEVMNREGATSASAILEEFEPDKLKKIIPKEYVMSITRTIFAHILRCYLDERNDLVF